MKIKRPLMSLLVGSFALLSCTDDPVGPPASGGDPDSTGDNLTPPAAVTDLAITYNDTLDSAVLTWTAPRAAGETPRVSRYDIRYAYSLPLNLDIALTASEPPTPGAPGSDETYEIAAPLRGRDLYVVIRSYDADGNVSPISGIAHQYINGHALNGQCIDVWTGSPLPGLEAVITARRVHEEITDANGRFGVPEVAGGAINVFVRGTGSTGYHWINHSFEIQNDRSLLYKMIEVRPTELAFDNILQTFRAAINFFATGPVFRKWRTVPVPVYVPEYTNGWGVVYDSLAVAAIEHWEARTGVDLFVLVDSIPDVGIDFRYLTPSAMGSHTALTVRSNDSAGYPFRDTIRIVSVFTPTARLFQVILHELGHTIRLEHLPHPRYIMFGSVLPCDISDDEVFVVQLHAALPNGINLSIYDANPTTSE